MRAPGWRRVRAGGRGAWRVVRQVYVQADEDDVLGLAAQLAFAFFLALFPFMIFLASLGAFLARTLAFQDPTQAILQGLGDALPPDAARLVGNELDRVIRQTSAQLLSFSILGAVVFASGGIRALMGAMNLAYDVQESRPLWKRFGIGLLLTLGAGGAILVASTLFVVGQVAGARIAEAVGLGAFWAEAVALSRFPIAMVLLGLAVSALYRLAPNVRMPLRRIVPEALLFVLGWLLVTWGFSAYVQSFGSYARTYGTLAGVVVALMWFYLTAVLLLLGAELTEVLDEQADPEGLERQRRRARREAEVAEGVR